jgi:hypothetical protein
VAHNALSLQVDGDDPPPFIPQLVKGKLGKGVKVWGCRYGERKSEKTYRFWLSKEADAEFTPREAQGRESVCEWCRRGDRHPELGALIEKVREGESVGRSLRER